MTIHVPATPLDPTAVYTVYEFLEHCHLDETITEFAIIRIVSQRMSKNPKIHPDKVTATGAEFLEAIEASQRVVELRRRRPTFIQVPGGGLISMSDPMPPLLTEMFNARRKS